MKKSVTASQTKKKLKIFGSYFVCLAAPFARREQVGKIKLEEHSPPSISTCLLYLILKKIGSLGWKMLSRSVEQNGESLALHKWLWWEPQVPVPKGLLLNCKEQLVLGYLDFEHIVFFRRQEPSALMEQGVGLWPSKKLTIGILSCIEKSIQ